MDLYFTRQCVSRGDGQPGVWDVLLIHRGELLNRWFIDILNIIKFLINGKENKAIVNELSTHNLFFTELLSKILLFLFFLERIKKVVVPIGEYADKLLVQDEVKTDDIAFLVLLYESYLRHQGALIGEKKDVVFVTCIEQDKLLFLFSGNCNRTAVPRYCYINGKNLDLLELILHSVGFIYLEYFIFEIFYPIISWFHLL